MVHNHPAGTSFSPADLNLLYDPVVAGLVIIGNDRSLYVAIAGKALDPANLALRRFAYETAREQALSDLERAQVSTRLGLDSRPASSTIDAHLNHIVMMALARAGVIEYRAHFGEWRKDAMWRCRVACNVAASNAAEIVQRGLLKNP